MPFVPEPFFVDLDLAQLTGFSLRESSSQLGLHNNALCFLSLFCRPWSSTTDRIGMRESSSRLGLHNNALCSLSLFCRPWSGTTDRVVHFSSRPSVRPSRHREYCHFSILLPTLLLLPIVPQNIESTCRTFLNENGGFLSFFFSCVVVVL